MQAIYINILNIFFILTEVNTNVPLKIVDLVFISA